jgi:hypothetical protein
MDKEQLIKNICTLVDKRINEEFHIKSDVAVSMLMKFINTRLIVVGVDIKNGKRIY